MANDAALIPDPGSLSAPVENEVQVWWARVPVGRLGDTWRDHLSHYVDAATLTRLARFHRVEDRDRGLAAHALFRRLLAAVAGGTPSELVLGTRCAGCAKTDHGKPYLVTGEGAGEPTYRPPVEVNLSHSGEAVGVALTAPGVQVGVDVEQRRTVDWVAMRRTVFADDEWVATETAAQPDRRRTEYWTRKEAAVKASGHGMSLPFREVVVRDLEDGGWAGTLPTGTGQVAGWDLDLGRDLAASVAVLVEGDWRPARPTVHQVNLRPATEAG